MNVTKRIIPLFMVFATIFSMLAVPVHAEGSGMATDASNYWEWIARIYTVEGNTIRSIFDSDVCSMCPDTSGRHNFVERHTTVDGQTGNFYVCEYCGKSAGEVGADAYNNYVQDLPASAIGSDGALYWTPTLNNGVTCIDIDTSPNYNASIKLPFNAYYSERVVLHSDYLTFKYDYPWSVGGTMYYGYRAYLEAPVSGIYSLYNTNELFSGVSYGVNGEAQSFSYDGLVSSHYGLVGSHSKGDEDSVWSNKGTLQGNKLVSVYANVRMPTYKIVITDGSSFQGNNFYSVDYRPTSISAPVYYTDNSGQVNVTTGDVHLFSENDMTLTNPQTGTTSTVTDWSYDYSSRTYDLTLDTGEHSTVTYGDENITIKEGDTTYIYNYYVQPTNNDPNGGGNSDPEHKHDYTREITRQASCTVAGQETYTCECGDTYTKPIPAIGHDWLIKEQVNSEYDENGEETTKGYTIYKCSRCGEEKRSDDGQPPDSGGDNSLWGKIGKLLGTIFGGLFKLIGEFFSTVLDFLIDLAEQIAEKLETLLEMVFGWFENVPKLFTGFMDFLAAMFGFLPEEIIMLLTFGIACVVFIGIIKAIRRR
jgi:hypothetical protein